MPGRSDLALLTGPRKGNVLPISDAATSIANLGYYSDLPDLLDAPLSNIKDIAQLHSGISQ
jgi:hypothetical protein